MVWNDLQKMYFWRIANEKAIAVNCIVCWV